jgi:hypothetical protein
MEEELTVTDAVWFVDSRGAPPAHDPILIPGPRIPAIQPPN